MGKLKRVLYNALKRGEKPIIVQVADYPSNRYTAYFEYFVDKVTFAWSARVLDAQIGKVLETASGGAGSYYKACGAAQRTIKKAMEKYRR